MDIQSRLTLLAIIVSLIIAIFAPKFTNMYQRFKVKSLRGVDLVLVPTAKWDGAVWANVLGELNGQNQRQEIILAAKEEEKREKEAGVPPAILMSPENIDAWNKRSESVMQYASYVLENNLESDLGLYGYQLLSPSEFYWFNCERIFGVKIRPGKSVYSARQQLMTTQYFKDAIVTYRGWWQCKFRKILCCKMCKKNEKCKQQ